MKRNVLLVGLLLSLAACAKTKERSSQVSKVNEQQVETEQQVPAEQIAEEQSAPTEQAVQQQPATPETGNAATDATADTTASAEPVQITGHMAGGGIAMCKTAIESAAAYEKAKADLAEMDRKITDAPDEQLKEKLQLVRPYVAAVVEDERKDSLDYGSKIAASATVLLKNTVTIPASRVGSLKEAKIQLSASTPAGDNIIVPATHLSLSIPTAVFCPLYLESKDFEGTLRAVVSELFAQ